MGQFNQAVETTSDMRLTHSSRLAVLTPLMLALGLAACSKSEAPVQQDAPGHAKLTVSGGELVLPAVSGNPGAAYFTLSNGTKEAAALAAVTVSGATKAEMHETSGGSMTPLTVVTLDPGSTVAFERGGKHVMLFGVSKSLKPGDTTKLKLNFTGGKEVAGELKVVSAGGEDHGAAH